MNFAGQGELLLMGQREKHSWWGNSIAKCTEAGMNTVSSTSRGNDPGESRRLNWEGPAIKNMGAKTVDWPLWYLGIGSSS